jgi:hypothetical protein
MATAMPMSGTPPYTYLWNTGATTMKITGLTAGTYTVTVTDANGCFGTHPFIVGQPTDLTVTKNATAANCAPNGTASVTPVGGTSPYSILWNNGQTNFTITNLAPGNYTFTVTDANGCTEGGTVSVTGSGTALQLQGTVQVPAGCNIGGSATVAITNSAGPFTYQWSNGQTTAVATNLPVGNSTVTVTNTATGCTGTTTVNVAQATPIITAITATINATCATGGSATVSASGSVPPYTYLWNNSQTNATAINLAAGTYTVTVTDATGCVKTATATVLQTQGPSVTAQVTVNASCLTGATATATASNGTAPYTYLWSNGQTTATATNLAAGTRTVTVTDANGCAATASVSVSVPNAPTVTAAISSAATCLVGATATATGAGGTAPYTYKWSTNATTATVINLTTGTYTVTVTDAAGCTATATLSVTAPTAPTATASITAAANCLTGATASAVGAGGQAPYTYKWSTNATTATVTNLSTGTYTVTVTSANGCTATATVSVTAPTPPNVVISASSAANCTQPGSATAAASGGGGGPYTYKWSNNEMTATAVNLSGGTFTVTVTAANGCTATTSVTIAQTNNGITVGDYVWYDNDQDGLQSPAELSQGVNNITVMLIAPGPDGFFGTADDITKATTTTNSAGFYQFTCVTPGQYVIMFSGVPTGYEFTIKDAAVNDCKDSDAGANGKTSPFTVTSGQANIECIDAGIHVVCVNVTYPGAICCDQTICSGDIPALLYETVAPSGGSGALEYLWMHYISVGQSGPQWYGIPGANSPTYQPGALTQTSYFMRCVRRAGCANFSETNIVTITVLPTGAPGCGGFNGNIIVSLPPSGNSVLVNWETLPEDDSYTYTVQHSINTTTWNNVGTVQGKNNTFANNQYNFVHQTPVSGVNFYRIMRTSNSSPELHSDMANIELSIYGKDAVSAYPNPFSTSLIVKNISKQDGDIQVDITAANGALMTTLTLAKGTSELKELATANWPAGLYFARLRFSSGEVKTVKLTKM